MGARAVWSLLRAEGERLSDDEKWVYGCELRRELGKVDIPPGADAEAKQELLDAFYADLTHDLALLGAEAKERNAWMPGVMAFYGLEEAP